MKNTNYRIIELPEYQVLLTKDYDTENHGQPYVQLSFYVNDVKIEHILRYKTAAIRDEIFESITDGQSQILVDNIMTFIYR